MQELHWPTLSWVQELHRRVDSYAGSASHRSKIALQTYRHGACFLIGLADAQPMSFKKKIPLAATIAAKPPLPFRQVTHPRFGPRFVLREFSDGNHKVEVEFASAGTKLLLMSYVQDASETSIRGSLQATRSAGRQRAS